MTNSIGRPTMVALIWDGFITSYGPISTFFGISTGLIAWKVTAGQTTSVFALTATVLIALWALIIVLQALRLASRKIQGTTIVLEVNHPYPPFESALAVCTIRPQGPWTIGSAVTFYRKFKNTERTVGIGTVRHAQQDEAVQVTLDRAFPGHEDYVKELCSAQKDALEALRIATGVQQTHIQLLPETKTQSSGPMAETKIANTVKTTHSGDAA